MKKLMLIAVAVALSSAFADAPAAPATPAAKPAAKKDARSAVLRHFGGKIARPRSQQGSVAVLDAQSALSDANLAQAVAYFTDQTGFKVVSSKVAPGKPADLKKASGANVAVVLVANDDDPPMLVAPEDGWAVVNVRRLKAGLPDNAFAGKMYETRCRKMLVRALALVCGGFSYNYKGNVLTASRVEDLDRVEEVVPYDAVQALKTYMKSLGVTPLELVNYRTAVKEGWAPAPTNEFQQAAWDKVKGEKEKGPTNPIKIVPPKK